MYFGIVSLAWQSPFADPKGQFEQAKKYGCDIYEIVPEDFGTINVEAINNAKAETGIGTPTITGAFGETRDVSSDDPEIRRSGVNYIIEMIDFATRIGAEVVAGPLYSAVGKARQVTDEQKAQAWDWATENIKYCANYAKDNGVKLAIEPLNRFETDLINTVDQGLELLDRIGMDNVGFLLDTFHMNIEEGNIPEAIRKCKGKIYDLHTCANTRGVPGDDNFDWKAIAQALKDADYNSYCLIESFTPDCVEIAKAASVWRPFAESPEAIAERGIPFLKKVFGEVYGADQIK